MTWRRWMQVAAVVGGLAMASTACGGNDGGGSTSAGGGGGGGAPGTTAPVGPGIDLATFEDPDDLDPSPIDLMNRTATSAVYLDDEDVIHVVVADGKVQVVDLTDALVGEDEELASMLFPVATCGDVVVGAVEGADGGELRAVDGITGELRWTGSAPDLDDEDGDGVSPLACTAGTLVTQGETTVVGLDATDGSIRWDATLEPDDPPIAGGDLVAIGTYDGVVGLDAVTGEERFTVGDGADEVYTITEVGFTLLVASGIQVHAPDGELLGELSDDLLDELTGGRASVSDLALAGSADDPVLVVPGTGLGGGSGSDRDLGAIVELDGTPVEVPTGDVGEALVIGASDDLVWVRILAQGEGDSSTTLALVDASGSVVAETDVGGGTPSPLLTAADFAVVGEDAGIRR